MKILATLASCMAASLLLAQPGTLDLTFGTNGKAVANVPGTYCSGQAIAEQADGKILVCGQTPGFTLVVRFNADGSIDPSFGTNGLVLTDVDASNDYIGSITVQPDGKILVAGNKFDAQANADVIVMRYLASGQLDNTFGSAGIATFNIPGSSTFGTGLALQADGRIVVCGDRYVGPGWRSFITRFNSDGAWDSGFGTVYLDMAPGSSDNIRDIALQADGKIVVCGYSIGTGDYQMAVARFNGNGTLDTGFGSGGKLLLSPGGQGDDQANSVRIQPDGRMVVTGISGDGNDFGIGVVRLLANGTYDSTFGSNGITVVPFGASSWTQPSLALQPDGKIAIGADNTAANTADVKVIRLLENGTLDAGFGNAGIGTSNATSGSNGEYAVRTQFLSDGGIAVAGYADGSNPPLQLAAWKFQSGLNVGLVENNAPHELLLVAPNPTNGALQIRSESPFTKAARVLVRDELGRTARLFPSWSATGTVLDVDALEAGVYSLEITEGPRHAHARFVKQ